MVTTRYAAWAVPVRRQGRDLRWPVSEYPRHGGHSRAPRRHSNADVRLRRSRSVVCCCRRRALRRRHLVPETNPADQKRAAALPSGSLNIVSNTSSTRHWFPPVDLLICYAAAPGLAATVSYQYLSARLSEGTAMLSARVAKSTVTKVVMSAAEKVSPAVKGTSVSLASMSP